jgi:hypothetical protein
MKKSKFINLNDKKNIIIDEKKKKDNFVEFN